MESNYTWRHLRRKQTNWQWLTAAVLVWAAAGAIFAMGI